MRVPLQITARNFDLTEELEMKIRERADKLKTFYDNIISCKVVVDIPHRHQQKAVAYDVRIDMTVPGGDVVVKREPNEDLLVALRDAFDAAKRQLQDYARRQRGEIKTHEESPIARVSALFPLEDYGFITTLEGLEVYFHRNSLVNASFDELNIGTQVRYVETQGDKGPQASTVMVVGS